MIDNTLATVRLAASFIFADIPYYHCETVRLVASFTFVDIPLYHCVTADSLMLNTVNTHTHLHTHPHTPPASGPLEVRNGSN